MIKPTPCIPCIVNGIKNVRNHLQDSLPIWIIHWPICFLWIRSQKFLKYIQLNYRLLYGKMERQIIYSLSRWFQKIKFLFALRASGLNIGSFSWIDFSSEKSKHVLKIAEISTRKNEWSLNWPINFTIHPCVLDN